MADTVVDPSILLDVTLWYQNTKVGNLVYLLVKDCGHLQNPNLRPTIKQQSSN